MCVIYIAVSRTKNVEKVCYMSRSTLNWHIKSVDNDIEQDDDSIHQ